MMIDDDWWQLMTIDDGWWVCFRLTMVCPPPTAQWCWLNCAPAAATTAACPSTPSCPTASAKPWSGTVVLAASAPLQHRGGTFKSSHSQTSTLVKATACQSSCEGWNCMQGMSPLMQVNVLNRRSSWVQKWSNEKLTAPPSAKDRLAAAAAAPTCQKTDSVKARSATANASKACHRKWAAR